MMTEDGKDKTSAVDPADVSIPSAEVDTIVTKTRIVM